VTAPRAYLQYIDGKFVPARSGRTFEVFDPSTEAVIATVAGRDAAHAHLDIPKASHKNW